MYLCMYLPGPSKGYQLVPKGCQFTIPLGFTWHPFKDAGICIYSKLIWHHSTVNWHHFSFPRKDLGCSLTTAWCDPKRCWHKNLVDGFFHQTHSKSMRKSKIWSFPPPPHKKKQGVNKKMFEVSAPRNSQPKPVKTTSPHPWFVPTEVETLKFDPLWHQKKQRVSRQWP